jgi:outer membrane murein-binding lipoprotein Lpp
MRTITILAPLVLCAVVAAGCGEDAPEERAAKPAVSLAERQAALEQDPYDLRCADLADKVASARMTRIVQYALADDAQIPGLNRLRASQSIFFAITELCKDQPGSYRPAHPAISGVRAGEFLADVGSR